jgi:DNA-nicking Smr family endonuclease
MLMTRKPKDKDNHEPDINFTALMSSSVKPLKSSDRVIHPPVRKKFIKKSTIIDDTPSELPYVPFAEPVYATTILSYLKNSSDTKILRQLKNKHYPIELKLDLHGFNTEEALRLLEKTLMTAFEQGLRGLLIIHGKGSASLELPEGSIMKNLVNRYLRAQAQVLAFCSARPEDGGVGAVYVLLQRGKADVK